MANKQTLINNEKEFYDSIKSWNVKPLDTDPTGKYQKGDWVLIRNGYDLVIGPYKILGFTEVGALYLNWSCWWFPKRFDRVIKKVPEDYNNTHDYQPYDPSITY